MATVTRHAIRVYSALAALKGSGGDVLDALVPFFDPILKLMDGKLFEPRLVVSGVRKMYHWRITKEVVEQFIPRLHQLNLLEKHGIGNKATYIVKYQETIREDDTVDVSKMFSAVVDEFETFPSRITDLLTYSHSRDELADILIRFLVSSNVLFQGIPNAIEGNMLELEKLPEGGRQLPEHDRYMAARFIQHLFSERPDLVPHLSRLASIGMLTELVDDFVRPTAVAERIDLTVVLDAPLALDYLGLSGKEIQDDIKTVIDTLKSAGSKIVVFPVTCGEMSENLKALLQNSPSDRHGYTHSAMIAGEVLPEYVLAVANNPEGALAAKGIDLKDVNLSHFPNSHKYFTKEMHDDFMSSIHWGNDINAKEHDADCLTMLMRLRDGKHSGDLFKCRYLFVTRNQSFAKQSRDYCLKSKLLFPTQEGPVIHQRELATATWLRTGLGASESIPRTHLVAHCNRVLQVRPQLTNAMRDKLRSFSQDKFEQFELLLLDQRSVRKLADETLNDERVVTGENAEELLELMRNATAAEVRTEYETKLEDVKRKSAKARRETDYKHIGEIAERDTEVRRLREMLEKAEQDKVRSAARQDQAVGMMLSAVNKSSTRDRTFANVVLGAFGLALVLDVLFGIFPDTNMAWSWALRAMGVIGIYQTIASIMHWPQWGLTDFLNWNASRRLSNEIVNRGLNWVDSTNFSIDRGKVEKVLVIEHDPVEGSH